MSDRERRTFLLEIGTEEIPAGYIESVRQSFCHHLLNQIWNKLIGVEKDPPRLVFHYTPRRLCLKIPGIPALTTEKNIEVQGPPAKVAKGKNGEWTIPAKKFAESQGVSEEDLIIKDNDKGSYVFAKKKTGGRPVTSILSALILDSLNQYTRFPRSMKWPQSDGSTFARPIRWICALFGEEVVEFEYAGLRSSNQTCGHRFAHPEAITINSPDEYVDKLRQASVIVDPNERYEVIESQLTKAAQALGGELVADADLLTEVTNLVECPNILTCNLGGFMELPREVLQTALAKHQRAFVVEKEGKLIPHFLVVTNSPKLQPDLARPWFERMAISRLEDADFFIKEDLETGLEALVETESRVEWIKGIGTLADKTNWLTELGLSIGTSLPQFNTQAYSRAAGLAKADLLTNLVREKEFTSLQGIAGGIYAQRLGENPAVCNAIREQYTDTPTSPESAVLAISDRLLNISATFAIGSPPKGSRDPFALRRQSTALLKIAVDNKLHLDIPALIEKTLTLFSKAEPQPGQIAEFMADRLQLYCKDQGFAYDWVNAVLAVAGADPYDAFLRLSAFAELDKGEEFKLVAVGQKRVANITRQIQALPPDTSLFEQEEEKTLYNETQRVSPQVASAAQSRDYKTALELLLSIRPAIDRFFDEVFVMVDDEKIKTNRLNLLATVKQEFLRLADFSQIVVE